VVSFSPTPRSRRPSPDVIIATSDIDDAAYHYPPHRQRDWTWTSQLRWSGVVGAATVIPIRLPDSSRKATGADTIHNHRRRSPPSRVSFSRRMHGPM
jgi:hypothetical protein